MYERNEPRRASNARPPPQLGEHVLDHVLGGDRIVQDALRRGERGCPVLRVGTRERVGVGE